MTEQDTAATPSATAPLTDAERREKLRQRIAQGEERHEARRFADQARDAADSALGYAREHPLRVVAGAVAVGLVVGALTRPGRRLGRRGGALAALAADAAIGYGLKAWSEAGKAGDTAGTAARRFGRDASYRLDTASDMVREGTRKATAATSRAMRDMRSRFTH